MQGQKRLADCPHLPSDMAGKDHVPDSRRPEVNNDILLKVQALQEHAHRSDLAATARRLGLPLRDGRLVIPCLGKDFSLGPQGIVSSCHVNPWLSLPILDYVLHRAGLEPKGQRLPLRDLPGGADWGNFFAHRCERPLKKIIDDYTALFELIMDIFAGQPVPEQFGSDIAVQIHPLPRLPILLCYWKPEDGMDSALHVFFDVTAEDNLSIDSIYILGVGLVTMFEKIARTHGK